MQVRTAHGIGEVVDRDTVRGRTQFLVAGQGFKVWVNEADVYHVAAKPFPGDEHGNKVDHDNSTTLPYDPSPQFHADIYNNESTLQPEHEIDADERLHPSDSLTFEHRSESRGPQPSAELFARSGGQKIQPWGNDDWERAESYDPTDDYRGHPDSWSHEPTEQDYADWEARHQKRGSRHQSIVQALPALALPLVEGIAGGSAAAAGTAGAAEAGGALSGAARAVIPGLLDGDDEKEKEKEKGGPSAKEQELIDKGVDESPLGGILAPIQHLLGSNDHYQSKFASIPITADHYNDPVQRFRDDPVREIHRQGHLLSAAHDPAMEEYGMLVEADRDLRYAAWADVRDKAKRLRAEGAVHVNDIAPDRIFASVKGDHGVYDVMIKKGSEFGGFGNGQSIADYSCSCQWGRWAFKRQYKFVGRLCFIPGTKVVMADGTLRAIEDVQEGDLVRSHTGEARKVTAVIVNHHDGDIYGVTPRAHETIWATGEHPFYAKTHTDIKCQDCWDKNRQRSYCLRWHKNLSEPMWTPAAKLSTHHWVSKTAPKASGQSIVFDLASLCDVFKEDDQGRVQRGLPKRGCVVTPAEAEEIRIRYGAGGVTQADLGIEYGVSQTVVSNVVRSQDYGIEYRGTPVPRHIKLDDDLAYLLGLYLGDGSHPRSDTVGFHFSISEQRLVDEVCRISEEKFGLIPQVHHRRSGRNIIDVFISSSLITNFFHRYAGSGHLYKRLAPEVLDAPASVLLHALRGWVDSDAANSVNRDLVFQMEQIALRNGLSSSVSVTSATKQGNELVGYRTRDLYHLNCNLDRPGNYFTNFVDGDTAWVQIQDVETRHYHGAVFNLSVEGEETYQVNGINVHNCSHALAAYHEMQSQYLKDNPHHFTKRTAGVTQDYKKWAEENGAGIDSDSVLDFAAQNPDLSDEQVGELFQHVSDNPTRRETRDFEDPMGQNWPDILYTGPGRSTPDLIFPADDDYGHRHEFTDLGDDRETTGPGQIVHFSRRIQADNAADSILNPGGIYGDTDKELTVNPFAGGHFDPTAIPGVAGGPNTDSNFDPKLTELMTGKGGGTPGGATPSGSDLSSRGTGGGSLGELSKPFSTDMGTGSAPEPVWSAGQPGSTNPSPGTSSSGTPGGGNNWTANDIAPNSIKPGDYEVNSGDTLSEIAQGAGWGDNYQGLGDALGIKDYNKINAGDHYDIPAAPGSADTNTSGSTEHGTTPGDSSVLGPNASPSVTPETESGGVIGDATSPSPSPSVTPPTTGAPTSMGDALSEPFKKSRRYVYASDFEDDAETAAPAGSAVPSATDLAHDPAEPGVAGNEALIPQNSAKPDAPASSKIPGTDAEPGVAASSGGGGGFNFDPSMIMDIATPLISGVSSFAAPIAQGIGNGIGNALSNGIGHIMGSTHEAFAGSGPDPKHYWGTSESYVDENERPHHVDLTDLDGDIIKYTKGKDRAKQSSFGGQPHIGSATDDHSDIVREFQASAAARELVGGGMVRTAGRHFTLAEQRELEEESHPLGARNKPTAEDLRGTHYVD